MKAKFLVPVTDRVVAAATQHQGAVRLDGVECVHSDSVVQAARLLWEALAPGEQHPSLPETTVPAHLLAGFSSAAPRGLDEWFGVRPDAASVLAELARTPLTAVAQVCAGVRGIGKRIVSDMAIVVLQFDAGAVLSVPEWRLDGSCYITYAPASPERWESAVVEHVARQRGLAAA